MLTSAKTDNFQEFFFQKLDHNKLLYKCAKFQVNSFFDLDFSLGVGGVGGVRVNLPPPCFNATSEPPCTIGLSRKDKKHKSGKIPRPCLLC